MPSCIARRIAGMLCAAFLLCAGWGGATLWGGDGEFKDADKSRRFTESKLAL